MFNPFGKNKKDDSVRPLNEEEIQKKLYGDYIPGTLGPVEQQVETTEDDLFEDTEPKQDSVESIEVEDVGSDLFEKEEEIEVSPTEEEGDDEGGVDDLTAQTTLAPPQEEELFVSTKDHFESLKITFEELVEKVKNINLKYVAIAFVSLLLLILAFNLISSYVDDESKKMVVPPENIQESTTELAPVVVTAAEPTETAPSVPESRAVVTTPITQADSAPTEAAAESKNFYAVQIAVSNDLEATNKLIARVNGAGFDGYYRTTITRRGNELYFVYVGQFSDRESANLALKKYRTHSVLKRYSDAYVTRLQRN